MSSTDGEYLYNVNKKQKVTNTLNQILFRNSYFECLIFFVINTSSKPYIYSPFSAQLQFNIDECGKYISLVYDSLNDIYIDPRNSSFNIEKEVERIKSQLNSMAKPNTTNDVLKKNLKLF